MLQSSWKFDSQSYLQSWEWLIISQKYCICKSSVILQSQVGNVWLFSGRNGVKMILLRHHEQWYLCTLLLPWTALWRQTPSTVSTILSPTSQTHVHDAVWQQLQLNIKYPQQKLDIHVLLDVFVTLHSTVWRHMQTHHSLPTTPVLNQP